MGKRCHILLLVLVLLLESACSTTRTLRQGEYRLTDVKVKVVNDRKFKTDRVESYIQQKPGSWNPMLYVYNWSGQTVDNAFDRFFRKIGTAPVVYNPDLVNGSVENLSKRLEYLGYYHSHVDTQIKVRGKKVKVTYVITLGKQYPISSLQYEIPSRGDFAEDFYKDTAQVTVRPGQFLAEESLEEESVRGAAHFRQIGYYGFNKNYYFFEADTLTRPGQAALTMRVREYTRNETAKEAQPLRRFHFGNVDIFYPKSLKFRERFLRKINTIHPGDPYSEVEVNRAYNRLSSLRAFSSVNVELEKVDSNVVDCRIDLTPSRLQGFKIKLEASSNSTGLLGISPELSYYHKNVFHGSEMLNLSFMGNFQFRPSDKVKATEYGVSAGITFPRFVGLPYSSFAGAIPSTEVKASYNYQNRPEYVRNIISTSFGYIGSHKRLHYQLYPMKLSIVRLMSIDDAFLKSLLLNPFMASSYIDHFDLGAGGNLYYTTNADLNPKTSYKYVLFQFNVAGNLLSLFNPLMKTDPETGHRMLWQTPYSQYIRGELTLGQTFCFGKNDNQSVAMRFLIGAGFAYGNSNSLPFEQHFYAGGANSMRGWQARSVGPGFSETSNLFVIPNQTGDMKLEADIEYRFPLIWKFKGALFAETGNVWNLQDSTDKTSELRLENFYESLAVDWGVGLRLDLDFILVRLDMGMKVYEPSRKAGARWVAPRTWLNQGNFAVHFGVGYPF